MVRIAACALVAGLLGGSAHAASGRSDLLVAVLSFAQHGTTLHVNVTVRDRGARAPASTLGYYLGEARIGGSALGPLSAHGTARRSATIAIPAGVRTGRYRLRACADDRHRVAEANERNNCLPAARFVELGDRTAPAFAGLEAATTCIPGPATVPPRSSSYRLTWQPATDDTTPQTALVYDIYQATQPGGESFSTPTYTTPAGATSFSTPALPGDKTYSFVVRARDAAGNRDANTVERQGRNLCVWH